MDVARGGCLVIMAIDHLPRNILGRFSNVMFGPFGFFTGASAFVLLSGLVAAWVYGRVLREHGQAATWRRTLQRAGHLYLVNMTLLVLVLGGVLLHLLTGPQWQSEFQPFFAEPWQALGRAVLLLYRPGYLDILPMFVFYLLIATPALADIQAGHAWRVMGLSALVWLLTQISPLPETNSLNPLAYQVLFVAGLIIGSIPDVATRLRSPRMIGFVQASLSLTAILFLLRLGTGVLRIPQPDPRWWHDLTHLERNGFVRVVNFAVFAVSAAYLWPKIPPRLRDGPFLQWLAYLGRHSLYVFVWSVAATYVSMALMPPSPSRLWHVMDMALTVSSLVLPARLHELSSTRRPAG